MLKANGRSREYNTLNQKVHIDDELTIHLLLPNSFQTKTIEDLRLELLTHLRKKFNNGNIKLVTEVERFEDKKLIYTNSEKFDHLVQKYPDLKMLKQRLDLDTDF
jgi:DNA polymerase-3 subunit gamma/tau